MTSQLLDTLAFLAVLLHGATLAAQSLTIGGISFALLVAGAAHPGTSPARRAILRACRRLVVCSALALVVTQSTRIMLQAWSLMHSTELAFTEIAGAAFFLAGLVTVVAALVVALVGLGWWPRALPVMAAGAVVILIAAVLTTHAAARVEHRVPLGIATVLHLGATAIWIGGLPYLLLALSRAAENAPVAREL